MATQDTIHPTAVQPEDLTQPITAQSLQPPRICLLSSSAGAFSCAVRIVANRLQGTSKTKLVAISRPLDQHHGAPVAPLTFPPPQLQ